MGMVIQQPLQVLQQQQGCSRGPRHAGVVSRQSSGERGKKKIVLPGNFAHQAGCSELVYEQLWIHAGVCGRLCVDADPGRYS